MKNFEQMSDIDRVEYLAQKYYRKNAGSLAVKFGKSRQYFDSYRTKNSTLGNKALFWLEELAGFSSQFIRQGEGRELANNKPGLRLEHDNTKFTAYYGGDGKRISINSGSYSRGIQDINLPNTQNRYINNLKKNNDTNADILIPKFVMEDNISNNQYSPLSNYEVKYFNITKFFDNSFVIDIVNDSLSAIGVFTGDILILKDGLGREIQENDIVLVRIEKLYELKLAIDRKTLTNIYKPDQSPTIITPELNFELVGIVEHILRKPETLSKISSRFKKQN